VDGVGEDFGEGIEEEGSCNGWSAGDFEVERSEL
jgi:hypothetical protein